MRGNWCRTGIGASILPRFYPSIIALNVFKRSIFCKREYIVKPARTFRNNIRARRPPFHTPRCRAYTCSAFSIKHPLTDQRVLNWCHTSFRAVLYSTSVSRFRDINARLTTGIAEGDIKGDVSIYIRLNHFTGC